MRRYLLTVAVVALLPSCTVLRKAEAGLDTFQAAAVKIEAAAGALARPVDTNADGTKSPQEWFDWVNGILIALGLGGLGVGVKQTAQKNIAVRNAASDARKAKTEAEVALLKEQVRALNPAA